MQTVALSIETHAESVATGKQDVRLDAGLPGQARQAHLKTTREALMRRTLVSIVACRCCSRRSFSSTSSEGMESTL